MTARNSSKTAKVISSAQSAHQRLGNQVPFFLRAWWLRHFNDFDEVEDYDPSITGPVWNSFADPLCDMGNLDHFEGY